MANGTRPIAPIRKVSAAVLGTIAVFIMLFGAGMQSWPIAALGIALLVLAISLLVTNVMRRGPRALVQGTAQVNSISEAPAGTAYGRAEMQVTIDAPGLPLASVRIRDPRVPVNKWPDPGATLPVLVAMDDMRYARIQWDDVLTHAEAAAGMGDTSFLGQHDEDIDEMLREAEQTPWDRRADDNPGGTPLYSDAAYAPDPYATDSYPTDEYPQQSPPGGGAPAGGDIPHGRPPQDGPPNPVVIRETPGGGIVLEGSFVAKDDAGVTQLPHRARRPRPHRTDAATAGYPAGTALADPPPAPGARSGRGWDEDDRDPDTDVPLTGAWSAPADEDDDRPPADLVADEPDRFPDPDVPDGDYSPRPRRASDLDPEMGSAYSPRGSSAAATPSGAYSPRTADEPTDLGAGYSPRSPRGEGRSAARPRSTDNDAEDDTRPSSSTARTRRADEDLGAAPAPSPFVDDEAYADHDPPSSGSGSGLRTAAAAAAGAVVGAAAAHARDRDDEAGEHETTDDRPPARDRFTSETPPPAEHREGTGSGAGRITGPADVAVEGPTVAAPAASVTRDGPGDDPARPSGAGQTYRSAGANPVPETGSDRRTDEETAAASGPGEGAGPDEGWALAGGPGQAGGPAPGGGQAATGSAVQGLIAGVRGLIGRLTGPSGSRGADGPAARRPAEAPRHTAASASDDDAGLDLGFEERRPSPRPRPAPGERRPSPGRAAAPGHPGSGADSRPRADTGFDEDPFDDDPDDLDTRAGDAPASGTPARTSPETASTGSGTAAEVRAREAGTESETRSTDSGTASQGRSTDSGTASQGRSTDSGTASQGRSTDSGTASKGRSTGAASAVAAAAAAAGAYVAGRVAGARRAGSDADRNATAERDSTGQADTDKSDATSGAASSAVDRSSPGDCSAAGRGEDVVGEGVRVDRSLDT